MSIKRARLSPDESRLVAVEAARDLLIEAGPQAVTLKAVAGRVGRTHANLLHHFGSAAGLQKALAAHLADTITTKIGEAVDAARRGELAPRIIVDMTFDAFDREGAGALASWMLASGNEDALDPVVDAIHRLVDKLAASALSPNMAELIRENTLMLVLLALGDSQLGGAMAGALCLPREKAREIATRSLTFALMQEAATIAAQAKV
ncbi:MAG TPA: TetR family transcriptional regulator [Sphingobium sp.]|jgi:AcrR family transcriptional regulator|uniref:TetR/AcrR family transcriptional regulator n=1 Tax=unclassified Sphingobium TaxID=2611147 RepID=UPI0007F36024|nr:MULTISPECIES: TetR family transcriptional regulator [unclassified Sphingobium]OAN57903.1 TetR family transcriptional regulator [Sphingobium sp. TCM1]WIW87429.1 TetR family transcriptional regulator [Sphingobium sp. V4]HAF42301.1 TetR family transcriptional regulator [Sphingobium sp.]